MEFVIGLVLIILFLKLTGLFLTLIINILPYVAVICIIWYVLKNILQK